MTRIESIEKVAAIDWDGADRRLLDRRLDVLAQKAKRLLHERQPTGSRNAVGVEKKNERRQAKIRQTSATKTDV